MPDIAIMDDANNNNEKTNPSVIISEEFERRIDEIVHTALSRVFGDDCSSNKSSSAKSSPAGKTNNIPIPLEAQKKMDKLQKSLTFNMEQVLTLEEEKITQSNQIIEYKRINKDLKKKLETMEDELKSNLQDTLQAQKVYELQIEKIVKDMDSVIAKFKDENDKIEKDCELKISNMKVKLKLSYEAQRASLNNQEALKAQLQSMQDNIDSYKKNQELHESFLEFHSTTIRKMQDERASLKQEIEGYKEYIQRLFEKIKAKEETIKLNNADALVVQEKLKADSKSQAAKHLEELKNIKDKHCEEISKLKVHYDLFTFLLVLFFFIVESFKG